VAEKRYAKADIVRFYAHGEQIEVYADEDGDIGISMNDVGPIYMDINEAQLLRAALNTTIKRARAIKEKAK
jgi:hypothetical protein